jgi:hypothetical protein
VPPSGDAGFRKRAADPVTVRGTGVISSPLAV